MNAKALRAYGKRQGNAQRIQGNRANCQGWDLDVRIYGDLGDELGNSETEESWSKFFKDLKARELKEIDIVISDNHGGLANAVERHFQGSTWQRR